MKKILHRLMAAAVLCGFLVGQTAFAADCCKQAAKNAKAGKTCAACETEACCKKAVEKLAKKGKTAACEKCAAKKKDKPS